MSINREYEHMHVSLHSICVCVCECDKINETAEQQTCFYNDLDKITT